MIIAKSQIVRNEHAIPPRDERPVCPHCGKRRFIFRFYLMPDGKIRTPRNAEERKTGRFVYWKFQGPGFFCSEVCAADYANQHFEKSKHEKEN